MQSNNQTFKAGDKVYYPHKSDKILTLKKHTSHDFPLKVMNGGATISFTKQGKEFPYDNVPSIFHVTKENHKKLQELYGVQFEAPKTFLDKHLELGSKVLCLIVRKDTEQLPKYIWELDYDKCDIEVIKKKVNNTYLSGYSVYSNIKDIYPIAIDDRGHITYLG